MAIKKIPSKLILLVKTKDDSLRPLSDPLIGLHVNGAARIVERSTERLGAHKRLKRRLKVAVGY